MQRKDSLEEFRKEWEAFLRDRQHKVRAPQKACCAMKSRDAGGKQYRWLLLVAQGKSKTLSRAERDEIRYHLARRCSRKEKAYVAIRFPKPENKVLVLPAERVLKRKRILAHKGGIPWGD